MSDIERFNAWLGDRREVNPLQSPTLFEAWSAAAPKWVPVSERLPDKYQSVLLGHDCIPIPITGFWTGEKFCKDVSKEALLPTHWMPLPEAPKD